LYKIKFLVFLFFIFLAAAAYSQNEEDKIIAVVGNDIITISDLNDAIRQYALQRNLTQIDQSVYQQVFQNMLFEKLMLAKADQDSITVSEDDVQKQMDSRLRVLKEQFGSDKNIETAYGLSMTKLKSMLKDDLRKQLKIEKLKQNKFGSGIRVSGTEVQQFYEQYKDSLPNVPETLELYQIVRIPELSEEAKKIAHDKAAAILDSIKAGADFAAMAKKYSDDTASAARGGDLGKVKKGIFVKEFEDAIYLLKQGQISDIVETQFGYHIIQVYQRTGDDIKARHILFKIPHLESEDFSTINFLKDLNSQVISGKKSFKQLAAEFSQDKESAKDSGYVGKVTVNTLDSAEVKALSKLNPGEVSDPVRIGDPEDYTYSIFMLKSRIASHPISLKDDYARLEELAQNFKEQKELSEWFQELKKSIFVDIKL
jgi:peptidyl-prolyl cis-trans isomerase SurA